MASQQSSLLVDTNVWLDCFLPNVQGMMKRSPSCCSLTSTNTRSYILPLS